MHTHIHDTPPCLGSCSGSLHIMNKESLLTTMSEIQEPTASALEAHHAQPPTYEEYVARVVEENRYKLDMVVDSENRGVDIHLSAVADEVVEWRLLVPHLRLKEVEEHDILSISNPALQRREAFRVWKKKLRKKATYGHLLKALLNGKCASNAIKKIVDILNNPDPDIIDHSSTTSSGSSSLPPVDLGPYFPYLPKEGRTEEEMKQQQFELHDETMKIRKAFASVVYDLKRNVEQTCKVEDVTTLLKLHDKSFEELLKDCKTPGEVFDKISGLVSFFDYDIIKLLGRKLGSISVKKKLYKYKQKFQEFSKRRMCECPCNVFGEMEDSEVVYVIKIDKSLETLTVKEVDKLEYKMNKILGHKLLRLLSIEEGCVQLKFRTLNSDRLKIPIRDQQALRKLGVLSVRHGDQIVDVSTVKDHDSDTGYQTGSSTTTEKASAQEECFSDKSTSIHPSLDSSLYDLNLARDLHDPRLEMMEDARVRRKELHTLPSIYTATSNDDLELVKTLVEGGANPLAKDINNDTALHYAARMGKLDILKYLINDVGCNPSTDGFFGGTVLHEAARSKHLHIVKYLVEDCQLDPTALDDNHQSALTAACLGGDLDIVCLLIDNMRDYMDLEDAIYSESEGQLLLAKQPEDKIQLKYDSFQQEPLSCACLNGHLPVVRYLVEECGCNPLRLEGSQNRPALEAAIVGNKPEVLEYLASTEHVRAATSYRSELPLVFYATLISNLQMIIYLVKKLQCDPLVRFIDGIAPIHIAALNDNLEILRYFIEHIGCSPTLKAGDYRRFEPIHFAAQNGHLNIIKYLLEQKSCNPSALAVSDNSNGITPLYNATLNGHLDLVRYLTIKHKCDPMQILRAGGTQHSSVHAAALSGHVSVLRHFFEKMRCDPYQRGQDAWQPIHCAAREGHVEAVKYLIDEQKVDPDSVEIHGTTALHVAVRDGHFSLVRYLIEEKKCKVSSANDRGVTLIQTAVYKGRLNILKYLVKFLDPMEGAGNLLLHAACEAGHLEIVKYLISEVGMDKDFVYRGITPLSEAAIRGNLPLVKYLLEIGSMHQDRRLYSPLHYAACNGYLELVEFLMNSHPDMYTCNANRSPLQYAVIGGQLHIVKYLIEERGKSCCEGRLLHFSVCNGHLNILKYLVEDQKCDPSIRADEEEALPFHMAVMDGHLELVKYFVEGLKCEPNLPDLEGMQPIHYAALGGRLKVMRYLVEEQRCDPNLPWPCDGNPQPIHCAADMGHLNVVKYLVDEQKVNPNATTDLQETAMHLASRNGHLDVVKYLSGVQGCDISIANIHGYMSIHIATLHGHLDIIKYLTKELHCDPDVPSLGGQCLSPIFLAVNKGNLKMVKFLVEEAGCDPSRGWVSNPSYTPLRYAYDCHGICDIFMYLAMILYQSYL